MGYEYKIVVSNKNVYKEFEIQRDMEGVKLGTVSSCEFRLNPDAFFTNIVIEFQKNHDQWTIECSDEIYVSRGDMRKLLSTQLNHGDILSVRYAASGDEAFELRFMIDFEAKVPKYNWKLNISERKSVMIGTGENADLKITGPFSTKDRIVLTAQKETFVIDEVESKYGVFVNGKRVTDIKILKNNDFISIANFNFYFKENTLFFDKEGVSSLSGQIEELFHQGSFEYPLFIRNSRVKVQSNQELIKILDPATKPTKPELNIVTTLMPTLVMFALVVVLRGVMSTTGGTYVIFTICSMGMGVVTSILSLFNGQKKYKKDCIKRFKEYENYIEKKREEIANARQKELECLRETYYSIRQDLENIEYFDSKLFDRIPEDEDYLDVYLGVGRVEAQKKIDYKKQEKLENEDELSQVPMELSEQFRYIDSAPIALKLKDANAVGIVGKQENLYRMFKNIVIDLASRHYYGNIKMYVLLEEGANDFHWIRLMPHLNNGFGGRNIVSDNDSKNVIFESLYKELSFRSEEKGDFPYNVILVMNEHGIKSHPISKFIKTASETNTVFVFFEEKEELLPLHCSQIINLINEQEGLVYSCENSVKQQKFQYENIEDSRAEKAVRKLAPIVCEEISLENSLRKSITLFELLGIYTVEDLDITKRWAGSRIFDTMEVPLGINTKNETVMLNLHEKFHGPHGLVAGTTGSGKSEILLTYILAAATLFHPYEIGFVIIDFKGGGMANQIKNLPHMVGAITNIDGKEINRSLKSIKAELLKRQTLFAEAEVNHIDRYIKLYKEGKVETALPHLVIIVDEFAELKAEQPEFMKELISTARIGRSLGVHLILATQKPAGQVNEQIWSNSKFKLCLKVQTQEDSNEVLKSPLAAEIREPGRAYLQVGNNEIFELFQSGFSGAPEKIDDIKIKKFRILSKEFTGKRTVVFEQKAEKSQGQRTQLDALMDYIFDFCATKQIVKLPDICLPPLLDCIKFDSILEDYELSLIPIGIYDDPNAQYQGCAKINICNENTLVVGSSQTGKTNFLQILIRMVVSKFSPKEAVFYIADFGAMYLKNFEKLNHVGGVVTTSEEERVKNLFKLLSLELQYRKSRFMQIGLSSFVAYREAGYTDLPQIFFIIDNFSMFKELYADSYEDAFMYLSREGIACGISIIITNSQANGIGFKYMANFADRLALKCNDSNEYGLLFDRCRVEPKDVPGRMLFKMNKELYELQTYLAFEGEKEVERSNAIKSFVTEINHINNGIVAKQIPSIPDKLTKEFLENNYSLKREKYLYHIALDYATVDVVSLDFKMINEFCIIGKDNVKKYFALNSMIMAIENKILSENVRLYIVDSVERPLKERADSIFVERYTIDYSEIGTILDEIYPELERRYKVLMQDGLEGVQEYPLYVVLINNKDVIEYISTTKELITVYNKILKQFKSLGIVFIFSDIEDVAVGYNAPELLKKFKETRKAIVISNLKEFKFCDIPSNIIRSSKALGHGDAYMMDSTEISRIKLIEED